MSTVQDSSIAVGWIAGLSVELLVPSTFVAARLYVRTRLMRAWNVADTLVMVAWTILTAQIVMALALTNQLRSPYFSHVEDASGKELIAFIFMSDIAICLVRVAIFMQLGSIFVLGSKSARFKLVLALATANILGYIACMTLQATSHSANLYWAIHESLPVDAGLVGFADVSGPKVVTNISVSAAVTLAFDVPFLVLPLVWIKSLQMTVKRKLKIGGLFVAGLFAALCTLSRLVLGIGSGSPGFVASLLDGNDSQLRGLLDFYLLVGAEVAIDLVVSCLLYMPRLFAEHGRQAKNSAVILDSPPLQRHDGVANNNIPNEITRVLRDIDSNSDDSDVTAETAASNNRMTTGMGMV